MPQRARQRRCWTLGMRVVQGDLHRLGRPLRALWFWRVLLCLLNLRGFDPAAMGAPQVKLGAKRIRPKPGARSRVGAPRDLDVLWSLAWAGYLSTSQLRTLHFPSIRTTQRRLRALLDHELIRAHLQGEALHLENVFTIGPLGAAKLCDAGVPNARPSRKPRNQKLAHSLAIRDVFVAHRLLERSGHFALHDFRFDNDLTNEPVFRDAHLVPDAVGIVERAGCRRMVGWEVDLGTETTATVRAKLTTWRGLLHGPLRGARLVLVAVSASRAQTLSRLALEAECAVAVVHAGELVEILPKIVDAAFEQPVRAERIGKAAQVLDLTNDTSDDSLAFRAIRK